MKSIRGTLGLETIVILGVMAIFGYYIVKPSSKPVRVEDTPIGELSELKDKEKKKTDVVDTKINGKTQKQFDEAQAATHATKEALERASNKNVSGDAKRELETAKDINDIAISALDQALDKPVDPKLLKWFIDTIDKKNSDIKREREYGDKMLAGKQSELLLIVEEKNKLIQEKIEIQAEYSRKISKVEKERDQWAMDNAAKAAELDRIYFWVFLAVGVYVFALIAPIIGKVFPAFAPIAAVAGAVVAPMVAYGKAKADDLAKDLVSLNHESKKFIENIDPAKVEDFKKHVSNWWENDTHSTHAVEEIKKTLRL